jgi:hypothetical protein
MSASAEASFTSNKYRDGSKLFCDGVLNAVFFSVTLVTLFRSILKAKGRQARNGLINPKHYRCIYKARRVFAFFM